MAKMIKKIIALALSFLCGAIAGMSLTVVNTNLSRKNQGAEINHNDRLSFGGFFGNGIMLTASAEEAVSSNDYQKGYTEYDFELQPGWYNGQTGEVELVSGNYHVNWFDPNSILTSVDFGLKIDIASRYGFNIVYEKTDGTYKLSNDITKDIVIYGNDFIGVSRIGINVFKADASGCTLEEAQAALQIYLPYRGGQTLLATVNEYATDKSVTWSVAWKDPSSTWASGKDVGLYVSLVPTSEDGLSVAVRWIQAFGEQVVITVTSNSNPDMYANCTVDYIVRLLRVEPEFHVDGSSICLGSPTRVFTNVVYSVGTLQGEFTYSLTFDFTDEFIAAVEESEDYKMACEADGGNIGVNREIEINVIGGEAEFGIATLFGRFTATECYTYLNNALHNTANEFEAAGKVIGTVRVSGAYSYSTLYERDYETTVDIYSINSEEMTIAVTSLALDHSAMKL